MAETLELNACRAIKHRRKMAVHSESILFFLPLAEPENS
jgi:hypothetical protein